MSDYQYHMFESCIHCGQFILYTLDTLSYIHIDQSGHWGDVMCHPIDRPALQTWAEPEDDWYSWQSTD